MQQLAKRIANGHKHQQGVASAVQLAPSSKDLKTQEHAENAANYHVKYGALYDRRDQTPPMLPRVVVDWLRTLREGAAQAAPLSQVRARGNIAVPACSSAAAWLPVCQPLCSKQLHSGSCAVSHVFHLQHRMLHVKFQRASLSSLLCCRLCAMCLEQLYAFGATRGPDFIHNLVRDAGWGTASRAAAAAGTDGAAAPGDEPADLAGAVPAAGAAAVGSARSRMRALR